MSKHTLGPWTAEPNGGDDPDPRRLFICSTFETFDGREHPLAEVVRDEIKECGGDCEANARLIAAAPDLLAAAKAAEEKIASVPAWRNTTGHNRLRAAIAAAEGG